MSPDDPWQNVYKLYIILVIKNKDFTVYHLYIRESNMALCIFKLYSVTSQILNHNPLQQARNIMSKKCQIVNVILVKQ